MQNNITTNKLNEHGYEDCKAFITGHNIELVQMDCVDGNPKNGPTILTLSFVYSHLLLLFLLPKKSSECVIQLFDFLEKSLGTELFSLYFGAILTDNSHEFMDFAGMEKSINGGRRTRIFCVKITTSL